jgi:hypothetical protein
MTTAYILHFQDSQVASVVSDSDHLTMALSAASVQPIDEAAGAAIGYLAPVRLHFLRATWQGRLDDCVGRLAGGELRFIDAASGKVLRTLPLPCAMRAEGEGMTVRLDFANGTVLHMTTRGVQCELAGDERYAESYAC